MIPELPDDAYLRWLYRQVASVHLENPSRTYWSLLRQLYTTEFVWFVPNDDNRVEDGKQLRYEFINDENIDYVNPEWLHMGCSMLEMLIALSRRLAFEAEGRPRAWFWKLMRNVGLDHLNDSVYPFPEDYVEQVLSTIIWRTYQPNGHGGLFPLKNAQQDQTKIEIWYQLSAYLLQ